VYFCTLLSCSTVILFVLSHMFELNKWRWRWNQHINSTPQPFYGPFSGTTRVSRCGGARGELLDFMVQGKINRGRHIDHPAGRHSIRTNQCPPQNQHINNGVICPLSFQLLCCWKWYNLRHVLHACDVVR